MNKKNVVGSSELPLRPDDPKNTVDSTRAFDALKHRPDLFSDEYEEKTLDVAALQIGLELKRARVRKGMRQEQLADVTGLHQSAISAIERGKGRDGPSFRTIRDIATALDAKVVLTSLYRASALECRVVSETPRKLMFEEGFDDALQCWALVRTLLKESAYTKVQSAIQKVLADSSAEHILDDQAICGLWRMEPESEARMTATTEVLVVATSPTGEVQTRRDDLLSGGYFAMGKGEIVVVNANPTPIGILTVPVTSSVAVQGRKRQHVDH